MTAAAAMTLLLTVEMEEGFSLHPFVSFSKTTVSILSLFSGEDDRRRRPTSSSTSADTNKQDTSGTLNLCSCELRTPVLINPSHSSFSDFMSECFWTRSIRMNS